MQMVVAAKQQHLQQICSAQHGELEEQHNQRLVQSQQDLISVTERLTAVVQLNSELLAENCQLTQQLQVCCCVSGPTCCICSILLFVSPGCACNLCVAAFVGVMDGH